LQLQDDDVPAGMPKQRGTDQFVIRALRASADRRDVAGGHLAMDEATRKLLHDLRDSPTDLTKLVTRIARRRRRLVAVPATALTRWKSVDPDSWEQVHRWLIERHVRIRIVPQ
jgi:hypothetical protein